MITFFDTLKQEKSFSLAHPPEGWWIQERITGEKFIGTTTADGYTIRFDDEGTAFAVPSSELSEMTYVPVSPIQVKMEISS